MKVTKNIVIKIPPLFMKKHYPEAGDNWVVRIDLDEDTFQWKRGESVFYTSSKYNLINDTVHPDEILDWIKSSYKPIFKLIV